MTSGIQNEVRKKIIHRSALRRQANAQDVANAVAYLLSDRAQNITGTVLTVDAGSTA
jgi:3-oxoacyl-[acyl-carrier protein] reductase